MFSKGIILLFMFVLFVLTNIIFISAAINEAKWSKTFITSGMYNLIVGVSEPSKSALRCSVTCSKSSQFESFYYSSTLQECHCNIHLDGTMKSTIVDTGLIYGIRGNHIQSRDCLALYQRGFSANGVYVIYPVSGVPVPAWCDMTGGGWTVIQRRQDGSENFNRTWNDYVNGFGSRMCEYWLGLENIRIMTAETSTLRIELETFGDVSPSSAFAEYSSFTIGSSASNYQLTVGGYNGNCNDSLTYHNGSAFSTRDSTTNNCAVLYKGAWWYKSCLRSNLNAMYLGGVTASYADGIVWNSCWGYYYSVKSSVMKIRRNM